MFPRLGVERKTTGYAQTIMPIFIPLSAIKVLNSFWNSHFKSSASYVIASHCEVGGTPLRSLACGQVGKRSAIF